MAEKTTKITLEASNLQAYKKAVAELAKTKDEYAIKLKSDQDELIQKVKEIDVILGTNSFGATASPKKGLRADIKTPLFDLVKSKGLQKDEIVKNLKQFPSGKVKMTIVRFVKNKQLLDQDGLISINSKAPLLKRGRKKAQ
jgi:hypothetical protein